jgi:transcriptional antiterminator NusG
MKWYVIKVVTGKEKKMKETIESELRHNGLDKFVSRLLVPSQKVVQIRNGKKYNIEKNFFPGYILVECESIKDIEGGIKHIQGVSSILKDALKQSEIDRILGKENEIHDTSNNFYLNQQVKIVDGPFASFVGTIQELNEEKKKVKIAVLIFGRETMLDLTLQQIEKD